METPTTNFLQEMTTKMVRYSPETETSTRNPPKKTRKKNVNLKKKP